jgi:uridine kinase
MTIVIGICGNSCSGKSTICKELINKYPSDITYLKADKFFKTKNTNFVNNQPIWNSPVDVAFNKLIEAVSNLKEGHKGFMPNKAFTEKYDKELKPNKIILIEGFLIYTNKELVSLFDKKIFLNIDNNELISRRLERNVNEDKDFIQKAVIEPAEKYEKIQKDNSDLIIDSNKEIKEVLLEIEKYLFSS